MVGIHFVILIASLFNFIHAEVLFVFEAFRHGARGPHNHLNGNKDLLTFEWEALGELTPVGMRMHYALGYHTRTLYKDFISPAFDPKEVFIVSTNYNRTIQSALSFIQGLYPSPNGHKLSEAQLKRATAPNDFSSLTEVITELGDKAVANQITVAPIKLFDQYDYMYLVQDFSPSFNCEAITKQMAVNAEADLIKTKLNEFNQMYGAALKKLNTVPQDKEIGMELASTICDHFMADYSDGRDVQAVLNGVGIDIEAFKTSCINMLQTHMAYIIYEDQGQQNILKASLSKPLDVIIEKSQLRIDFDRNGTSAYKTTTAPKFVIHSIHDVNLMGIMLTFEKLFGTKVLNPMYPLHASNLRLEVEKNGSKDYVVNYIIEDSLIKSIPYDDFVSVVNKWKWNNTQIESYCNWKNEDSGIITPEEMSFTGLYIALGILSVLFVSLSIGFIVLKMMCIDRGSGSDSQLLMSKA